MTYRPNPRFFRDSFAKRMKFAKIQAYSNPNQSRMLLDLIANQIRYGF